MSDILNTTGKNEFLETVNRAGYILEERAYKVLKDLGVTTNQTYRTDKGRVEIDLILGNNNVIFVIECKKTYYDWVFTHGLKNDTNFFLTMIDEGKPSMTIDKSSNYSGDYKISKHQISVKISDDKTLEKSNNNKDVRTSDTFNKNIYQLLENFDVFLEQTPLRGRRYIIPVIVTNARLFYMQYGEESINDFGDLSNFKLEPQDKIVFNFPYIAKWQDNELARDRNFGCISEKSIFIVNIKSLREFIQRLFNSFSRT